MTFPNMNPVPAQETEAPAQKPQTEQEIRVGAAGYTVEKLLREQLTARLSIAASVLIFAMTVIMGAMVGMLMLIVTCLGLIIFHTLCTRDINYLKGKYGV